MMGCAEGTHRPGAMDAATARGLALAEMSKLATELKAEGLAVPRLEGKLLRPIIAYGFVPPHLRSRIDERFWYGALAIQMVHEASLLHDDILDEAAERRGAATVYAQKGVGPALVLGDHYLTSAYSVAARTGSMEFLRRFIHAVERTVAGEIQQARAAGAPSDMETYDQIIAGKSGELLGAAACLSAAVLGLDGIDDRVELGCRVGAMYQRIDDLLDYCDHTETGKPPLQDYRQGKWTWIAGEAGLDGFRRPESEVLEAVFGRESGRASAAECAVAWIVRERDRLVAESFLEDACPDLLHDVLNSWTDAAKAAVSEQPSPLLPGVAPLGASPASAEAVVVETASAVGGPDSWASYFGTHAKTFSLAARLFPKGPAEQIRALYAYCRVTDDLVDDPADGAPPEILQERLAVWHALSRHAYEGKNTGIPLLEAVMGEAREASVEWLYPQALLDGVGMDLEFGRYESWRQLGLYTFGVAGAVGGWMTQLFGIRDQETLECAHSLGHAMQLTNIVRDVGEDLDRDRVYLPREVLLSHDVSVQDLRQWKAGGEPLPEAYRRVLEEVMAVADACYDHARPGLVRLPGFFRRPVAAAASAYRGIHEEIRKNDYDNLRQRAYTTRGRKLFLGAVGMLSSSRLGAPSSRALPRVAS